MQGYRPSDINQMANDLLLQSKVLMVSKHINGNIKFKKPSVNTSMKSLPIQNALSSKSPYMMEQLLAKQKCIESISKTRKAT
jgi:hypothetical protein